MFHTENPVTNILQFFYIKHIPKVFHLLTTGWGGGGTFFPKMSHQKLALVKIEKLHLWVLTSCSGLKQRNWNKLLLGTIKY